MDERVSSEVVHREEQGDATRSLPPLMKMGSEAHNKELPVVADKEPSISSTQEQESAGHVEQGRDTTLRKGKEEEEEETNHDSNKSNEDCTMTGPIRSALLARRLRLREGLREEQQRHHVTHKKNKHLVENNHDYDQKDTQQEQQKQTSATEMTVNTRDDTGSVASSTSNSSSCNHGAKYSSATKHIQDAGKVMTDLATKFAQTTGERLLPGRRKNAVKKSESNDSRSSDDEKRKHNNKNKNRFHMEQHHQQQRPASASRQRQDPQDHNNIHTNNDTPILTHATSMNTSPVVSPKEPKSNQGKDFSSGSPSSFKRRSREPAVSAQVKNQTSGNPGPSHEARPATIVVTPFFLNFLTADATLLCHLALLVAVFPTRHFWTNIVQNQLPWQVVACWLLVAFTAGHAVSSYTNSTTVVKTTAVAAAAAAIQQTSRRASTNTRTGNGSSGSVGRVEDNSEQPAEVEEDTELLRRKCEEFVTTQEQHRRHSFILRALNTATQQLNGVFHVQFVHDTTAAPVGPTSIPSDPQQEPWKDREPESPPAPFPMKWWPKPREARRKLKDDTATNDAATGAAGPRQHTSPGTIKGPWTSLAKAAARPWSTLNPHRRQHADWEKSADPTKDLTSQPLMRALLRNKKFRRSLRTGLVVDGRPASPRTTTATASSVGTNESGSRAKESSETDQDVVNPGDIASMVQTLHPAGDLDSACVPHDSGMGGFDVAVTTAQSLDDFVIEPLFKLRGMDVFLTDDAETCVATHPWLIEQGLRDVPTFIVNYVLQWGNIIVYFEMPRWVNEYMRDVVTAEKEAAAVLPSDSSTDPEDVKALKRFLDADDDYRNQRFKVVASVVDAPMAVKVLAPAKKEIVIHGNLVCVGWQKFGVAMNKDGRKLMPAIECSIDCMSSGRSIRSMSGIVKRNAQRLSVDMAFVVGKPDPTVVNKNSTDKSDDEPEACLGMWRFNKVDIGSCPHFPDRYSVDDAANPQHMDPDVARANDILRSTEFRAPSSVAVHA